MLRTMLAIAVVCTIASGLAAENWPGFEKDNLHQNASGVDINPANLTFNWVADFSNPVDAGTSRRRRRWPAGQLGVAVFHRL